MATCRRCGEDNPARARFCLGCGAPLQSACPSCGEQNPPHARFCLACGTQLGAQAAAPTSAPPPTSASRELRKTVTVVFCDVTGSTTLGERLDPESLRRAMTRYFDEMRAALERHGGTVEKFIGDAVMAVFGIPVVHEDDALRAVRAAAEMRAARDRLNPELERTLGVRIEARIGVNTGEVVAGDASTGEGFATGDTVNVAARLEQAAPPGEILIGEPTYRLVRDAVKVEPVDALTLKGKSEPVPAYRLLEADLWAAGYARRHDVPLVGRRAELQRLEAEYAALLAEPRARLVTVVGAAGTGKSRLTNELLSRLDGARIVSGRCLSYGEGVGLWPVMEIVRSAAGIDDADSEKTVREKIRALLPDTAESQLVVERVATAIGIGDGTGSSEETFWGVRKLLEALAAQRPLVAVVDDCQWAAPTMLDLVEYVAGWTQGVPLLLVCLARPDLLETRPAWTPTLTLTPLTDEESEELVDNLGGSELAPELRRRILETAEGNPLFVEQLVALVREGGDTSIPPTIHALISARLDRLANDERHAIECGAIEGKVFHLGAVQHLTPETGRQQVSAHLLTLVRKDLVAPHSSAFGGDDAFRFRNLVVRDAAYTAMPKQARAELHERFADWLARRTQNAPEYDPIVAHHVEQAYRYRAELGPVDERARALSNHAADLYSRAGERALDRGDVRAGADSLDRAVELFAEEDARRIHALVQLGAAVRDCGDLARAEDLLRRATRTTEASVAAHARIELLLTQMVLDPEGKTEEAKHVGDELIPAFEAAGDHAGLSRAWRLRALRHWVLAEAGGAETALERGLAHARASGRHADAIECLSGIPFAVRYGPLPLDEAEARIHACREQGGDSLTVELAAEGALAGIAAARGRFDEARIRAARARELCAELGHELDAAAAAQTDGYIERQAGDLAAAAAILRDGCERLQAFGERGVLATTALMLGDVLYAHGERREAEKWSDLGVDAAGSDDVATQALGNALRAKLAARRADHARAQALAVAAVELIGRTDFLEIQGDVLTDAAEVHELAGRADDAGRALRAALDLYERKGVAVSAERVRAKLEQLAPV